MKRASAHRQGKTKGFVGLRKKDGTGRMIAVRFDEGTFKRIGQMASLNQRSFAEQVRVFVDAAIEVAR